MMKYLPVVLVVFILMVLGGLPFGFRSVTSTEFRNFRTVEHNKFYRSGQMSPAGFRRIMHEYHIQTVISLRDRMDEQGHYDDQEEQDYCLAHHIRFERIPPCTFEVENGVNTGVETMATFLNILDDPKTRYPVLIHCFAGIHRTGAHVAVYRMTKNQWSADDAIMEMMSMGTPRTTFASNLIEFLSTYQR